MAGMTEAPVPLAKSLEGVIKEVSTGRLSMEYGTERLQLTLFTCQIDEAVRDEDMKFGSWDHIPVAW
jgi:hypothetical protein